jgi:benzoyl-CoA reductase subunit C
MQKERAMSPLDLLRRASDNPGEYARQWKTRSGGKVIGHFCSYTPQEMISAAGGLSFRILSAGSEISRADAYLQAYSCSLVRSTLEDALAGRLDFLDGTVFPHTCDSIMRLSDIWRMNTGFAFHADLIMPAKLDTPSAAEYMLAVLRKFKTDLQTGLGIEIDTAMLQKAIRTWNRVRRNLARLYALRVQNPRVISGSDLHAVFKAALVMDPDTSADALDALISELPPLMPLVPGPEAEVRPAAKRLVLSGGLCSMPDIHQVVEASGGHVVWDDFCTSTRYFEGLVDETRDPLQALAQRYLKRVVCPAKHSGLYDRGNYLIEKVRENQAQGVIFLLLKFCDPHAFDYPYMKAMLDKEGIPSLMVEIEDQIASEGQLRTRCEAFMEML